MRARKREEKTFDRADLQLRERLDEVACGPKQCRRESGVKADGGSIPRCYTASVTDFKATIAAHQDLPEDAQKQAGKAIGGVMSQEAQTFLDQLLSLIEKKDIVASDPKSFLNRAVYDKLSEQQQDQIDLALINLGHLLENVINFRLSKLTPDSSPHLETMILELRQMKSRIEEKAGDVFKF